MADMDVQKATRWGSIANALIGLAVAVMSALILSTVSDIQRTLGGLTERADNADKINEQQGVDIRANATGINGLSNRLSRAETRQSGLDDAVKDYGAQINAVRSRQDAMRKDIQSQDGRIQKLEER